VRGDANKGFHVPIDADGGKLSLEGGVEADQEPVTRSFHSAHIGRYITGIVARPSGDKGNRIFQPQCQSIGNEGNELFLHEDWFNW